MFNKFCRGKDIEPGPLPNDRLPNHFDPRRRTSVSAECWTPYSCGQGLRWPPRSSSVSSMSSSRLSGRAGSRSPSEWSNSELGIRTRTASAVSPTPEPTSSNTAGTSTTRADVASKQTGLVSGAPASSEAPVSPFKAGWDENEHRGGTPTGQDVKSSSPASIEARKRAEVSLRRMIFFEELSQELMEQVLDAMQLQTCEAGVNVITQGDEGNVLFVLDSGEVEFIVNGEPKGTASAGATFGELALLYNAPRAATVRSRVPCVMYTLDRLTLKSITVAKHSRKRLHSQQVLAQIDVFADLPAALQLRIADALHPTTYKYNDTVIRQGDSGTEFFLIDEGTVEIITNGEVVSTQGSGSYFGELALIYDIPRAATVRVTSKHLKVEVLSSRGFEQLIGAELVAELRKRDPRGVPRAAN